MSVPTQKFSEPQGKNDNVRQALLAAVEQVVEKYLHHRAGEALTRQEIGAAFTQLIAQQTGLGRNPDARELLVAILQLIPSTAELMKNGTELIDHALTNLVRRGTVYMTLLDTQIYFWLPDRRPVLT